mgnify:CR=1 FL=1
MTYDTSTPRGTDTHVRLVSASLRLCVSASLRHPYSKLGGAARPTRDRALRPASAAARAVGGAFRFPRGRPLGHHERMPHLYAPRAPRARRRGRSGHVPLPTRAGARRAEDAKELAVRGVAPRVFVFVRRAPRRPRRCHARDRTRSGEDGRLADGRAAARVSALERVERRRVSFFPSLFIRVVVVLLRFATPNILGRREGFGFGSAAPASERATRGLGVVFVTRQERDALG